MLTSVITLNGTRPLMTCKWGNHDLVKVVNDGHLSKTFPNGHCHIYQHRKGIVNMTLYITFTLS